MELRARILVVDDDPYVISSLEDLLRNAGFDADGVRSGSQMRQALARSNYALVLLGLQLEREDGITLARELRRHSTIPFIMMSGSSDETDRILLLELGADDFVVKPFSPRELVARVRAVLRRYVLSTSESALLDMPLRDEPPSGDSVRFGSWLLDLANRQLLRQDGTSCELTQAEFRLLEVFIAQPHKILTRDDLLERTRSSDTEVLDRTIDVLVLRLRRKIEPNPKHPRYICTERRLGYVFAAKLTRA